MRIFTVLFFLLPFFLFAEDLKLVFTDREVSVLTNGTWAQVDEGVTISSDQQIRLSSNASAVLTAGAFKMYLSNPSKDPRTFLLQRVVQDWKKTAGGQNLLAGRLEKLIGTKSAPGENAHMGVRGADQGQLGTSDTDTAEHLWAVAQQEIKAGRLEKAVSMLTELLDWAEGDRLDETVALLTGLHLQRGEPQKALIVMNSDPKEKETGEGTVLLAQIFCDLRDWSSLEFLADRSSHSTALNTEQKQAVLYLKSIGELAQGKDSAETLKKLRDLDPASEWALRTR